MSFDAASLGELYPWTPRRHTLADGRSLSYLDTGQGERSLLMIHGNPTWSFYYRGLVKAFEGDYRCVVPDHIGAGLSDKPQDYDYTLAKHVENLTHLVDALDLRRVTLVVHDWGGPIGALWALRHLDRVERLVVFNTSWFPSRRIPFSINICRIPGFGALAIRGANAFARAALVRAAATRLPREVQRGYLGPYGSWADRIGHLRFVQDIPMHEGIASWAPLQELDRGLGRLGELPMLICWGGKDFCFNDSFLAGFQERFAEAEVHRFADAGHYVLEDAGPRVVEVMKAFFAANRQVEQVQTS